MRKHRGILTIAALLALGGISLGVGLELYLQHRLPDPEQADLDGLMRWLVVRDLAEESAETRQKIVRRLEWLLDEQDAEEPLQISDVLDQIDEEQTERFWSNVYLLTEIWFLEHVERYDRLSETERPVFIAGMIDRVTAWGVLASVPIADPRAADADFATQAILIRRQIEPWVNGQAEEDRRKVKQFLDGVSTQLMARQFSRWLSG